MPVSEAAVGLDPGVLRFAALSTGEMIPEPPALPQRAQTHQLLSQVKDRPQQGSHRRKRAAIARAMAHRRVRNQRQDFHHQVSRRLVNAYGLIAMEDLSIRNLMAMPEPKPDPEHEGQCLQSGKAAKRGAESIDPRCWLPSSSNGSAPTRLRGPGGAWCWRTPTIPASSCLGCGRLVPKDLGVRWHACECDTELDRDHNAAITMLFGGEASGPQWYAAAAAHSLELWVLHFAGKREPEAFS